MKNLLIPVLFSILFLTVSSTAQDLGKGDASAQRIGIHNGNRVNTVFNNWGIIAQPGNNGPAGAWIYPDNKYVGDVSPLVGVRLPYKDYNNDGVTDTVYSVIITDVDRPGGHDYAPGGGKPWAFQPLPGFTGKYFDPSEGMGVAMSHLPDTWPSRWPDHPDWVNEMGSPEWNGYFGRGQANADQESYYVMDDHNDEEMYLRYGFMPDSTDPSRRGQGIRMSVRGLQWSDFLAQDVVFWLYNISNIGTTPYDQVTFGTLVGTYVGLPGDEWNDDASFFNIKDNITYSWDYDHYVRPSANPNWQPTPYDVGYIAYSFLESPGNKYDGIDNDGDSKENSRLFEESDFKSKTVKAGDKLILIDPVDYSRSEFIMPSYATEVYSQGKKYRLVPDSTVLMEGNINSRGNIGPDAYDGYDNDFDGLIDENYQLHYKQFKKEANSGAVLIDTLNPVRYNDFKTALVNNYFMIDEARDDGIDNDRDWSIDKGSGTLIYDENGNLIDDVGADGKMNTADIGENDGVPTAGEPNFDATDVDESDQVGLTSFNYFVPGSVINMSDELDLWNRLRPGQFDVPASVRNNAATRGEDGDFIYGSGYFPLLPGNTERFSLAFSFGYDLTSVIKTKRIAQFIYDANYNFPRPPDLPTLKAVPGDGVVTLYWDKVAELSVDPVTREKDFEGYFVYKSTSSDFNDIMTITDRDGNPARLKPYAQFDLDNDVSGIFPSAPDLNELRNGVQFYLGDNTGIQNTFVDTDVKNGVTYFYAVSAYDRGVPEKEIYPSENSRYINKDIFGNYTPAQNCAVVTPNAPVAGYIPPEEGGELEHVSGTCTGKIYYEMIDKAAVKDASYEVTFIDSLSEGVPIAYAYKLKNTVTGKTIYESNKNFSPSNNDIFDGITLSFDTRFQTVDSVKMNFSESGWLSDSSNNLRFTVQPFDFPGYPKGIRETENYRIVFYDTFDKETTPNLLGLPLPAKKVNFEIYNVSEPDNSYPLPFTFVSLDSLLTRGDRIIMASSDTSLFTWTIDFQGDPGVRSPGAGDTLKINILKPISSRDKFGFSTSAASVNRQLAREEMEKIKVVPNPYIVSNIFEGPLSSQVRGRGERAVKFIHLPVDCSISIFTAGGNLVRKLDHSNTLEDGTVTWDLRSEEGLDVAYGVYFYVVEDRSSSLKKFGKIALIK